MTESGKPSSLVGPELKGRITQAAENMFTLRDKNTGAQRILTGIVAGAVIIGALISLKNFDPFKNGVLR